MPIAGFIHGSTGEKIPFDEPYKIAIPARCYSQNDFGCGYSIGMLAAYLDSQRPSSTMISATLLLYCLKDAYFRYKYDYYLNPKDDWLMFRGVLLHRGLEGYKKRREEFAAQGILVEERFSQEFEVEGESFSVSGKADLIDKLRLKIIDYKNSKVDKITRLLTLPPEYIDKAMRAYAWQLNIYRLLSSVPATTLQIVFHTEAGEFVTGQEYPLSQLPAETQGVITHKLSTLPKSEQLPYYNDRVPFVLPAIPIIDEGTVYNFTRERGLALHKAFKYDEVPIERGLPLWRCRREVCRFYNQCKERGFESN